MCMRFLSAFNASLAVPALGALAIDPLLSVVDTAFVGHLGKTELGGLGVATAVFNFTFRIFNFLSAVTAPLVAQVRTCAPSWSCSSARSLAGGQGERGCYGSNRTSYCTSISYGLRSHAHPRIRYAVESKLTRVTALNQRLFLATIGSDFIITSAGGVAEGASGAAIRTPALDYLHVRALALPGALLATMGIGAFRCASYCYEPVACAWDMGLLNTRVPLLIALGTNVINLGLDGLLIYGLGPVPALGIKGAAWATTVAEWASAATFLVLLRREGLLRHAPSFEFGRRAN
eukprot:scaffold299_cov343-Prasinococcus_capsulatus_cf.AAC.9